jgi:hypothetical protein
MVALGMVLATPSRADKTADGGRRIVIGIVAVGVAVVVATVLIIHYSKKRKITGCVNSGRAEDCHRRKRQASLCALRQHGRRQAG